MHSFDFHYETDMVPSFNLSPNKNWRNFQVNTEKMTSNVTEVWFPSFSFFPICISWVTSGMSACLCLANTDLDMIGVKYSSRFSRV